MAPGHGDGSSKVKSQVDAVNILQSGSPRCCDRMTADMESVSTTVPALSTPHGITSVKAQPKRTSHVIHASSVKSTNLTRANRILPQSPIRLVLGRLVNRIVRGSFAIGRLRKASSNVNRSPSSRGRGRGPTRDHSRSHAQHGTLARIEHPASHPHPCLAAPSSYAQGLPSNMLVQADIAYYQL